MIKKLLFLLFLISFAIHSQQKKVLLRGKVTDSLSVVKNANIVNINTNQGTSSTDLGEFEIYASLGDSLRISSIQHKTSVVFVSKYNYKNKIISVPLKYTTYTLDEFELKKHNLTGKLDIDSKTVPKSKRDSLLKITMDFSNVDFSQKDYTIDQTERSKPPIVNTMAGAMPMIGGGVGANIPFKDSERLWALRKKLALKKEFPQKVLNELGEDFFFKKLKIPVENYFHFLEYCNPLGIEDLHQKGNLIEIIKIFREESKTYLKIIKKE